MSICTDFDDFVQPGIMQVRGIPGLWPGPGLGLKLWSLGLVLGISDHPLLDSNMTFGPELYCHMATSHLIR